MDKSTKTIILIAALAIVGVLIFVPAKEDNDKKARMDFEEPKAKNVQASSRGMAQVADIALAKINFTNYDWTAFEESAIKTEATLKNKQEKNQFKKQMEFYFLGCMIQGNSKYSGEAAATEMDYCFYSKVHGKAAEDIVKQYFLTEKARNAVAKMSTSVIAVNYQNGSFSVQNLQ